MLGIRHACSIRRAIRLAPRATWPIRDKLHQQRRFISPLALSLPEDAWDSHIHVVDPQSFPLAKTSTYEPHKATLASAISNADQLGLPNLVFVQPSVYAQDNSCLLDALQTIGPSHGRGVVVLDPDDVSFDTLNKWHTLGVRGVRLNMKSVGLRPSKAELFRIIEAHADVVRVMKTWALQLYIDLAELDGIVPLLPKLGVKIVLDHYGAPSTSDLSRMRDWSPLLKMMDSPLVFTKLSAPYRLTTDAGAYGLETITKELFRIRGGKGVVFASDWPHTRFEGADVKPFIQSCLEWCSSDEILKQNLFRENAKELWDIPQIP